MTIELKIASAGALFVCAFGFGIWTSRAGRPLNTAIFTVHKLIALAAIIFSAVTIVQLFKGADLGTLQLGAVAAAGLLLVITFATGVWLSIAKSADEVILAVHKVVPVLTVLTTAATICLLAAGE